MTTSVSDLVPLNLYYQMPPYRAFAESYLLLFLFLLLCSSVMLFASLYGRKVLGFWIVMLSIAAGIVLCSVKTKWMWLFPVSHSILWIHFQDYYRQYVFPPILSLIVLLVLIVIVYAAVALAAKRIDIDRLRGEQE